MIGGLIWFLLAAVVVGAAGLVAFARNVVHCAFGLLLALVGVCTMYMFLGADFLAITQVVVYVGGILVLMLFGVMMTHRISAHSLRDELVQPFAALAASILVFALSLIVIYRQVWPTVEASELVPTTRDIGRAFLTSHLFPFEFASVLLLVAMMGAAMLSREKHDREGS